MKVRMGIVSVAVAVVAGLLASVSAVAATGATAAGSQPGAPYCGIVWGSTAKSGGSLRTPPLLKTRTGQHDCFDRLVFEFDGAVNGYAVRYGAAHTGGEGLNLAPYTAGGATLSVELRAPAYDRVMRPTYPHRVGDHVANVARYRTLRDVVYAGSYEGYTTFSVGVRARLPFRVMVLSGPGTHSRIVVDVAHQW